MFGWPGILLHGRKNPYVRSVCRILLVGLSKLIHSLILRRRDKGYLFGHKPPAASFTPASNAGKPLAHPARL